MRVEVTSLSPFFALVLPELGVDLQPRRQSAAIKGALMITVFVSIMGIRQVD